MPDSDATRRMHAPYARWNFCTSWISGELLLGRGLLLACDISTIAELSDWEIFFKGC